MQQKKKQEKENDAHKSYEEKYKRIETQKERKMKLEERKEAMNGRAKGDMKEGDGERGKEK